MFEKKRRTKLEMTMHPRTEEKRKEIINDKNKVIRNIRNLERMKILWVKHFKNKENEAKYEVNKPLPYMAWALELWLSTGYMWSMVAKDKNLKWIRLKIMKDIWKEMQDNAEWIIADTLNRKAKWDNAMDLKDVDRARFALDFKKSTDKVYNPTSSVEVNFKELDIENYDDMKRQLIEELNLKI